MTAIRGAPALFALMIALLLAAACGDDSREAETPSPSPLRTPAASPAATLSPSPSISPTDAPSTPEPSPDQQPVDIGLLTVVDKQTALPFDYVPPGLTAIPAERMAPGFGSQLLTGEALDALAQMLDAASAQGYDIRVRSAYRSYEEQGRTFQYWVNVLGEAEARRVSAEPGHSEHQLGTTADLTSAGAGWELSEGFGATAEGRWLAAHSHEYGFALSYPKGAEAVTGYAYEPWHFRYIGRQAAADWKASGLTLAEFLRSVESG